MSRTRAKPEAKTQCPISTSTTWLDCVCRRVSCVCVREINVGEYEEAVRTDAPGVALLNSTPFFSPPPPYERSPTQAASPARHVCAWLIGWLVGRTDLLLEHVELGEHGHRLEVHGEGPRRVGEEVRVQPCGCACVFVWGGSCEREHVCVCVYEAESTERRLYDCCCCCCCCCCCSSHSPKPSKSQGQGRQGGGSSRLCAHPGGR